MSAAPSAEPRAGARGGAWLALASLLGSGSTLLCCALPALLVALGAGAALSSLVAAVPQLVWLSEHKAGLFTLAGVLLALAGLAQWRQRHAPCPLDPGLRQACLRTRRSAARVLGASLLLYAVGGWFAFVQPWLSA